MAFNPVLFYEYGKSRAFNAPNTFIGGVASTINTPALLASALNISVVYIKNFSVNGDDIQCHIGVDYNITIAGFKDNTSITNYIDLDGHLIIINSNGFRACTNLTKIYFPKCTDISVGLGFLAFYACSSLNDVYLPLVKWAGTQSFADCTSLVNLDLPSLLGCAVLVFDNCSSLETLNIPKCTNLGNGVNNNNVFLNIKLGCVINIDSSRETCDGGAPDGDLVYAINTRGATVNYIVN